MGAKKLLSANTPECGNVVASEIVLQPAVQLAPELLAALADNHPLFAPTWNHPRDDLSDQSCSGYDMALTGIAVACGLTDQQIADILVVHRRKFPGDKQVRQGRAFQNYLQRTIGRARQGQPPSEAAAESWRQFENQALACEATEHSVNAGTGQMRADVEPANDGSANPDPDKQPLEAAKLQRSPAPFAGRSICAAAFPARRGPGHRYGRWPV
jgi:hypothetical protein